MVYVIRVDSLMIPVNESFWQKSLYLFTKAEMEFYVHMADFL